MSDTKAGSGGSTLFEDQTMQRRKLTQVDVKGTPLLGTGVEVAALYVQVARADRLRPQTIEQRHLGPRRNAHCGRTGGDRGQ